MSQPWGGRWKPGGRPAVRPAASGLLGAAWPQVSLEELDAAPCGLLAPLCSPHVLCPGAQPSVSRISKSRGISKSPVEASNQTSAPQRKTVIFLFMYSFTFQIHYN